MDAERTARTRRLIGDEAQTKLENANVLLFGTGGVGSFTAEALARAGIGKLTIVDKDVVDSSNINRQIIALGSTVGRPKTEVLAERIHDINPEAQVDARQVCFMPDTAETFRFEDYDYVVDAVDMVSAKLLIIEKAKAAGVPVISSMGTGNKTHPELLEIGDISKTHTCPLAKVMRKALKDRRIKQVPVVWSPEEPRVRLTPPGSMSFVPSTAGLLIASRVINDLAGL